MWRWITLFVSNQASYKLLVFGYLFLGSGFVFVGFLSVNWLDKVPSLTRVIDLFPQQIISFTAMGSGQGVQPNQLAGTLLWLFPVALGLSASQFVNRQRLVWVVTGLLGCTFLGILILSQSRGGWLGGITGIGMFLWLIAFVPSSSHWYSRMRTGWPILVTVIVVLALFISGPATLAQMWIDPPDQTAVGNLGTLTFRQEVWVWAMQAIQDFSVSGTGLGSFRAVVHRLYPIAIPVTYDIAHAHNVFLQIALDMGLPGLIFYLTTIIIYIVMGWQVIRHGQSDSIKIFVVSLIASQIGFHVYGLVDAIAVGAKPGLLFWIQLGLMSSSWRISKQMGSEQEGWVISTSTID
ncbi:MAG: O-antigen ligase family protein [Chloroflexota bacterium]